MLGTMIGDIIGSPYEFNNIKTKEFPLISKLCHYTDDTVMTVAVSEGFSNQSIEQSMIHFGKRYIGAGYGERFKEWILNEQRKPYGSYGNGAAMRVSSLPYYTHDLKSVLSLSDTVTNLTHNNDQSIRGARAVVHAIYMAQRDGNKERIKQTLAYEYDYDLNFKLDDIRPKYKFNVSCDGSVPQAIVAFLEGESYEDVVRNAVSIGGDSDTIAAIAGGIAEAFYEYIPAWILAKALPLLEEEFLVSHHKLMGFYHKFVKPKIR